METETHIDGDTIKGPRADMYPILAEGVAPEYLQLFHEAPRLLLAARKLAERVDSEVAYGDEWPEFEILTAICDRLPEVTEGRTDA